MLRLTDAGVNDISAFAQQMLEAAVRRQARVFRRQLPPNGRPGKADAKSPKAVGRFADPPADVAFFQPLPALESACGLEDRPLDFYRGRVLTLALRITEYPSPRPAGKPLMRFQGTCICAHEAYLPPTPTPHGTPYTPEDLRAHSAVALAKRPRARLGSSVGRQTETVQTRGYAPTITARTPRRGQTAFRDRQPAAVHRREALAKGTIVRCCPSGNLSALLGALWLFRAGDNSICQPGCGR